MQTGITNYFSIFVKITKRIMVFFAKNKEGDFGFYGSIKKLASVFGISVNTLYGIFSRDKGTGDLEKRYYYHKKTGVEIWKGPIEREKRENTN